MAKTRIWKDRTGNFKVEAEFLGVSNGKVRLHKVNGVVIDVPVDKMASEDVKLIKNLVKRDRERQTSEDDIPLATSSVRSPDNDRERKEREKRHRAQQHQKKKPQVDWFDFFLSAGCDLDDCTRYAHNFERDRIDEEVLPELEANTLRNLGLREGDLIRVRKHIKAKFGRSAAIPQDDAGSSKVESGDKEGPGLFTGPSGGLKSTRRGRPTPSRGGADSVNPDGLKNASEELSRVSSPPSREAQNASPSPSKGERRSSSVQPIVGSAGGFDDDAWTVKPSSKPATPQPAPAPAPSAAPAAPSPQPQSVSPTPQQPQSNNDLAEDILKRMGITDKPSISAASQQRQTASGFLSPNTLSSAPPPQPSTSPQPNPNGPRGPFAPVAQNAPMLNPLVPTQTGFSGFIPTRPASGGMQPQATGMSISMNSGMSMAPQPTGMMAQPQMSMGTSMPMSMAPQPTGFMMQQQQTQPTGFQNPQMTSFSQPQMPQYQSPSPQVNVQPTGMGQVPMSGGLAPQPTGIFSNPSMFGGAPQQQPQPTGSTPANKYEPGNVFAAMKSGQSSMDSAPQSSSTYDALRPQMTGVPAQPLQPQPTGFASMQMQMPTQTGMPGYGYY